MNELQTLYEQCLTCTRCPLSGSRTNIVFGQGNPGSHVLFVGEAPGEKEDLCGQPFVGRAGMLLTKVMEQAGLDRKDVYITNILKCRPPQNRDPNREEEQACLPYLLEQIRLVRPVLTVCLGRIAASRLIRPDFRIMKEHGIMFETSFGPAMAILHPAAVLRNIRQMDLFVADMNQIARIVKGSEG